MVRSKKNVFSLGSIVACLAMLISIFSFSINVQAQNTYVNEIEPNDTRSQAQEIQENQSTPEGMYNPTLGGTYQMNGNSSINDEDWFKVNLTKGTKYMTCGEKAFDFLIEDSAGNVITEKAYSTSPRI